MIFSTPDTEQVLIPGLKTRPLSGGYSPSIRDFVPLTRRRPRVERESLSAMSAICMKLRAKFFVGAVQVHFFLAEAKD